MKFSKYLLIGALSAGFLTGCANDDDYDAPVMECINPGLTATKSVADILATATETPTQYTQDDIIEAYVTSSDERGAFFKVVSLQTHPTDGSAPIGFSIDIDGAGLFTQGFVPGTKVMIKLKDLYYGIDFGSLEIGALFEGQVGRISEQTYKNHIFVNTCEKLEETDLVTHMTVAQALNDANINRLIEIDNVEFLEASFGSKLYDANASTATGSNPQTIGGATNHFLIDQEGNKIVFRTSSFANFSGMKIPEGSGSVRGVLTKFLDTYQFVARYESDIMMDQPRFIPVENSSSAQGGTDISYLGSSFTGFEIPEGYTVSQTAFPKLVNDYTTGGRYWQVKSFGGNQYVEMTSFNGSGNQGVNAKTYLFVPVDFGAASKFSFDKEIRYMAGTCLKVYRVDPGVYVPRTLFDVADFLDITSSFTQLTYPATGASQNNFTTAGTYLIPDSLTGNGFFVFEYSGGGAVTTTVQLDNIKIE